MRMQIQNLILSFISGHPGTRIADVVRGLPDVERSSISSALTRMAMRGKITRVAGRNDRFEYTLAKGGVVPVIPAAAVPLPPVPKLKSVSKDEWDRRFNEAESLLNAGLNRRANTAFLELLDVTADTRQRESIIRRKAYCLRGLNPAGDGSTVAGRFVGDFS